MKKILFILLALTGIVSVAAAGQCSLTVEQMFADPNHDAWCSIPCLDQVVRYTNTHSRAVLRAQEEALKKGINRGRMCATAVYHQTGESADFWNDMVDRQNYIYHQAGLVGHGTEHSVNSDGSHQPACMLGSRTPCPSRIMTYGGEIRDAYQTCMSEFDKKMVFTNIVCIYYLEAQTGNLMESSPNVFYHLVKDAQSYASREAQPLARKIILDILGKMERHITGCNPDVKNKQMHSQLEEVVVVGHAPKKESIVPKLELTLEDKLNQGVCMAPPVAQEGDSTVVAPVANLEANAGTGTGNGEGDGDGSGTCSAHAVTSQGKYITVFIPCRRE